MAIISGRRLLFEQALQETGRKLAIATIDPAEATQTYKFKLNGFHDSLGYIPRSIVERIAWSEWWSLDHQERSITLFTPAAATTDARSKIVEETLLKNKELGTISLLQNWRKETFPVYGPEGQVLLSVERCASALFGMSHVDSHSASDSAGDDMQPSRPLQFKSCMNA